MKYKLPKTCDKILFYVYENEHLPQSRWKPLTENVIGVKYNDFIQAMAFLETIGLFNLDKVYASGSATEYIASGALSDGAHKYVKSVNPTLGQKEFPFDEMMSRLLSDENDKIFDKERFLIYHKIKTDINKALGKPQPDYFFVPIR